METTINAATWRDSHDRCQGAGEAHGGAKTERGTDSGAGIDRRRAKNEARLL
jgi:hypothetical protein